MKKVYRYYKGKNTDQFYRRHAYAGETLEQAKSRIQERRKRLDK